MFYTFKKYCAFAIPVMVLSLCGCNLLPEATDDTDLPEPGVTTYVIPKGEHYATENPFKKLNTQKLRFEVTFDSSAVYTTAKPENQNDINKLYGLSDCGTYHHINSARIGWRWTHNRLELLAYTYTNEIRQYELISSIPIGKPVVCEIALGNGTYTFNVGGKIVTLPRLCNGLMEAYQLYPYFGGDEVAPHEIKIKIKDLL